MWWALGSMSKEGWWRPACPLGKFGLLAAAAAMPAYATAKKSFIFDFVLFFFSFCFALLLNATDVVKR
jgi:hypothetical protein